MKCLTWNTEWATAASARGKRIKKLVNDVDPDLLCFTEATLSMIPSGGYVIKSGPDYGYPNKGSRRKVLLWSKQPWQEVDTLGSSALPNGRFAAGITQGIRFAGVCIPWRDAHVRTGRKDRTHWEDHLQYLDALTPLVAAYCAADIPVCVTGDFNQRIPRSRQPLHAAQRLSRLLDSGLQTATAGILDAEGQLLIDHVATSEQIQVHVDQIIPKKLGPGTPLSDHVGILATITAKTAQH